VIARNFLWLSATQVAGLVVGLFSGIYARRVLGPVAIGQYSWCHAVLAYIWLVAEPRIQIIALEMSRASQAWRHAGSRSFWRLSSYLR
jgi:O-antigen/teichoic acid export membrane protein